MTSLGRLEVLLLRVHDGLASPEECAELAALGGAVGPVGDWEVLGDSLRSLVDLPPVDLADEVLAGVETPAWSEALRAAVMHPVDVTDAVMAGIEALPELERMAFGDGELTGREQAEAAGRFLRDAASRAALAAYAGTGAELREAVGGGGDVDVWNDVAAAIGAAPVEVEGWEQTASQLRASVAARAPIDVADIVMRHIQPAVRRMPLWASLGGVGALAAAAAALLAIFVAPSAPSSRLGAELSASSFLLAAVNDAQVEDIATAGDMVAQVVQFDDGGPTFIILDDPDGVHDPDAAGAPL